MPQFEYLCPECGDTQEAIFYSKPPATLQCRYCKGKGVKQISAPSSFPVGKYGKANGGKP